MSNKVNVRAKSSYESSVNKGAAKKRLATIKLNKSKATERLARKLGLVK